MAITTTAVLPPAVRDYYDRLNLRGLYKSSLIDLEALTFKDEGDRAQAGEGLRAA